MLIRPLSINVRNSNLAITILKTEKLKTVEAETFFIRILGLSELLTHPFVTSAATAYV